MSPRFQDLYDILSIPNFTFKEKDLIDYCIKKMKRVQYLDKTCHYHIDEYNNLYITRGISDVYPCVCAHTDSVCDDTEFKIKKSKRQHEDAFIAVDKYNMQQCFGGDDKAGVYACLKILLSAPIIKVALFASEEAMCYGSRHADKEFFQNVGYIIELDCPNNYSVSEYSNGIQLFDRSSLFYNIIEPVLRKNMYVPPLLCHHPYTDVWPLKINFDVSCINLSTGYYKEHSNKEYVVVDDVQMTIRFVRDILRKLGNKKYPFVTPELEKDYYFNTIIPQLEKDQFFPVPCSKPNELNTPLC